MAKNLKTGKNFPGGPGPGRPKGMQNKTTLDFKLAITNLLEYATPQMTEWLSRVADENPEKALSLVGGLAEYAFPKLSRTELVGDKDQPLAFKWQDDA